MLEAVKRALSITTDAYDAELEELIDSALADLAGVGIVTLSTEDPRIRQAVKTYTRAHFKNPDNYDKLLASYEAQKGALKMATGYTVWGVDA